MCCFTRRLGAFGQFQAQQIDLDVAFVQIDHGFDLEHARAIQNAVVRLDGHARRVAYVHAVRGLGQDIASE